MASSCVDANELRCVDVYSNALSPKELNTAQHFTNGLPHAVDLSGWEVQVRNATLPTTWFQPHRLMSWRITRLAKKGTATGVIRRAIYGNQMFPDWKKMKMGPYAQWVIKPEGYIVYMTLQPNVYQTGEEVALQMIRQIEDVFEDLPQIKPKLTIKKHGTNLGIIEEDDPKTILIMINRNMERVLHFCDRDPINSMYGGIYMAENLPQHLDPKQGFGHFRSINYGLTSRWGTYAGHVANKKPYVFDIDPKDYFYLGPLYFDPFASNPHLLFGELISLVDKLHTTTKIDVTPELWKYPESQRMPQFFCLCADFCEHQWINDQLRPVLAVLSNPGKLEGSASYTFHGINEPFKNTLPGIRRTLSLWWEDEQGNPLPLQGGVSRVQLYFKKKV